MAPRKHGKATLIVESQVFAPYINDGHHQEINIELSLKIAFQIIIENTSNTDTLQATEIVTYKRNSLAKTVEKLIKTEPGVTVKFVDGNYNKLDFILCSDGDLEKCMLRKLNQDGFIVFYGDEQSVKNLGIPIVYQNTYKQKGIFLLRNITPVGSHEVILVNNSDFFWLEKTKECIKTEDTVYLFTQRDNVCGIVGLVKCINLEPKEKASVKCVFIQERDAITFNPDLECYKGQLRKKLTINILKNGIWGSYRHIPVKKMKQIDVAHASSSIETIGDFSSLKWFERPFHYYQSSPDADYIFIYYAALNFKDVTVATGQVVGAKNNDPFTSDVLLGFEYSGISESGTRVMGISNMPSISLQIMSDRTFTWNVPKSWSLEEAATVPVVYATCYYSMIVRSQIKLGSSILIHDGASGVGIAAISVAFSMGCEVFTTCGSEESRELLLKIFPELKHENIGNVRNISFNEMVMENTKDRGVDIVFNSLATDMFEASIECVSQGGQFLEIGNIGISSGIPINSVLSAKNVSFHSVLLDDLLIESTEIKEDVNRLFTEGITKGVVRPIPRTVFAEDEVEDAFRFLSTGKHKGKVLIQIRNEIPNTIQSSHRTIQAVPKIYFHPDKTYIVIGGLEEFDFELVNFLITRCARKIILNSRLGVTNGYQSSWLKKWSELEGVTVKVNNDDTSTIEGAESVVEFAEKVGHVGGIFNVTAVVQDALFMDQSAEKFNTVFKSKYYSGQNMDKVSRERCHQLDHFVVFSSIAAGRGNVGQSNSCMANSAMERICEVRQKDGLPGLAVQYGPIGGVGVVTDGGNRALSNLGLGPQSIDLCLNALETFILQPYAVGSTFVIDEEMMDPYLMASSF